jgi:two-component system response regulator FixJ
LTETRKNWGGINQMSNEPTVFVVDDDELARESVSALVQSMGVNARVFSSAEQFLGQYVANQPGCLVTDVRMVGMSGLELQDRLNELNITLPVVVLTAFARTPLTVRAMQNGALTLLEKPCEDDELWDAIRKALVQDAEGRAANEKRQDIRRRIGRLTSTQRRVMDLIVAGKLNKQISEQLDMGMRTVEARRSEVFDKTGAESLADLVRLAVEAEPKP